MSYVTLKGHTNVILVNYVLITLSSLIILHVPHLVLHSLGSLPTLAGLRIASMKIWWRSKMTSLASTNSACKFSIIFRSALLWRIIMCTFDATQPSSLRIEGSTHVCPSTTGKQPTGYAFMVTMVLAPSPYNICPQQSMYILEDGHLKEDLYPNQMASWKALKLILNYGFTWPPKRSLTPTNK